jgi:WavE lipopolysaccharide synthesis
MISPAEISVVVQGPVAPGAADKPFTTAAALAGVRRLLPEAELILSTWPGSDLAGLSPHILVQPTDPGPQFISEKCARKYNNLNRQIVSTAAGLRAATRPWAVKLRTDSLLTHTGFLAAAESFPRAPRWSVLSERLLTADLGCVNPRLAPELFHVSDLFHFGRREDLLAFWDAPLAPEPETSQWFVHRPPPPIAFFPEANFLRYSPEQYLWLSCLRRRGHSYEFFGINDVRLGQAWASEQLFLNNFRCFKPDEFGLALPPHIESNRPNQFHYTGEVWSRLCAETIARRANPGYRLRLLADVLRCRERQRWRTYSHRHSEKFFVRMMRRRAERSIAANLDQTNNPD